jgi:hypothetical protein
VGKLKVGKVELYKIKKKCKNCIKLAGTVHRSNQMLNEPEVIK